MNESIHREHALCIAVRASVVVNETREYVKRVLTNTMLYAHLLNQTYVPLSTRLGLVPPGGSEPPLAAAGN